MNLLLCFLGLSLVKMSHEYGRGPFFTAFRYDDDNPVSIYHTIPRELVKEFVWPENTKLVCLLEKRLCMV